MKFSFVFVLVTLIFGFLSFNVVDASVPTSYGYSNIQRTAFDAGNTMDWCLTGDGSFTSVSGAPDVNGFVYYTFDYGGSSSQIKFNHDDACNDSTNNYQIPAIVANRSAGYHIYAITSPTSGWSSVEWMEYDGDEVSYSIGAEQMENYSFGGESYTISDLGSASGLATSSGNTGLLMEINNSSASALKVYAIVYDNVNLLQIASSLELQQYMTNLIGYVDAGGEGGSGIPESDTDYVVITSPVSFASVPYNFDIFGHFNLASSSPTGCSWRMVFTSQTGIDYSSYAQSDTSEICGTQTFSVPMTFYQDDAVYVRVYLYEGQDYNAVNLRYISPEYIYSITASGDASSPIDFGTFRTGTSTCGYSATSTSWFDFGYGLCVTMKFLFIPGTETTARLVSLASTTQTKFPFAYLDDVFDSIQAASSSVATSSLGSLSIDLGIFGESEIISTTTIREPFGQDMAVFKPLVSASFVIGFLLMALGRVREAIAKP